MFAPYHRQFKVLFMSVICVQEITSNDCRLK